MQALHLLPVATNHSPDKLEQVCADPGLPLQRLLCPPHPEAQQHNIQNQLPSLHLPQLGSAGPAGVQVLCDPIPAVPAASQADLVAEAVARDSSLRRSERPDNRHIHIQDF